jgi:hypothetical protein
MDEMGKKARVRRYERSMLAAVLLLCGLMFLIFSCEREDIPDSNREKPELPEGEPVQVNFMVNEMGFGENEVAVRNASPTPPQKGNFSSFPSTGEELETVVVPITDNIYMYATLVENETPVSLRAIKLNTDAKVRVVAYTCTPSDTVNSGYADYEVLSDGNLNPTSHPLFVKPGSYKFVAYSFHNTNPLDTFADTTAQISPVDVLWGDTTEVVNPGSTYVKINMKHMYSEVKMQASLDSVVVGIILDNITNARVSSFDQARLIVLSGRMLTGAASMGLVPFTWQFLGSGHALAESYPTYIFTNGASPKIEIGSVTIDGAPYSGPYTVAYSTALQAGKSYTLSVNFVLADGCADILYLAPDSTLSVGKWKDGQITMQNLLFFKFGGVVGFTAPNPPAAYTWDVGANPGLIKFNPTTISFTSYTGNPAGIPGYTTNDDYNQGANRVLNISDPAYHKAAFIRAGKGDPCKLVNLKPSTIKSMSDIQLNAHNSGWRLATYVENLDFLRGPAFWFDPLLINPSLPNTTATYWGSLGGRDGGWFPITGPREITTGRTTRTINQHGFLPITGYYTSQGQGNNNRGVYNTIGSGAYWSGTVAESALGYRILFDQSFAYPTHRGNFANGHPVRCVRTAGPY